MADRIANGGPAFAMPGSSYTEDCGDFSRQAFHGPQTGMSLRDYFAAQAMVGLQAGQCDSTGHYNSFDALAVDAYQLADAMLKARSA